MDPHYIAIEVLWFRVDALGLHNEALVTIRNGMKNYLYNLVSSVQYESIKNISVIYWHFYCFTKGS